MQQAAPARDEQRARRLAPERAEALQRGGEPARLVGRGAPNPALREPERDTSQRPGEDRPARAPREERPEAERGVHREVPGEEREEREGQQVDAPAVAESIGREPGRGRHHQHEQARYAEQRRAPGAAQRRVARLQGLREGAGARRHVPRVRVRVRRARGLRRGFALAPRHEARGGIALLARLHEEGAGEVDLLRSRPAQATSRNSATAAFHAAASSK